jgi:VWFA-related protein
MRKFFRGISIILRVFPGRTPKGFIGINGSNSWAMNPFRAHLAAVLFPAVLCACILAEAQENSEQPQQTIRLSVDRVNVGVIVTDARGNFVEGLRRENFHIFDNGIERPLTDFAAREEPAQVLLLIEAGPAVYLLESGHLWAANTLLDGLAADDRVAVVKYAEGPEGVLDFTADKQATAAALGDLRFNLGFGSLNLTSSVSKVLEWLERVPGKKAIVLLSTGLDTSALNEAAAAIQQLKISDVLLLTVSLAGGFQSSLPANKKKSTTKNSAQVGQQFEQANQLLVRMAEATGGRAYFPKNPDEFSSVYAEIAQLVRHEYSVAFAPPVLDGKMHAIDVRIELSANPTANAPAALYRVDHRQAYVTPAPK